jgi:hypothetical protein
MLLISCVLRSNYFGEVKWKKKKGGILVRQRVFCLFYENSFLKIIFQTFIYLFIIKKLVNKKYFLEKKTWLSFQESVFLLFLVKNTFRSCEKFINILLFVDYIKFGPQSFDCYIFCFESFFFISISSFRIWFNLIFI